MSTSNASTVRGNAQLDTEAVGIDHADAGAPGGRIGRYVLTGSLGRGGMGVVLAAHDPELDRKVALKLLHPGAWGDDAAAAAKLEREAQAMAKLSHPNVVTVYEVGRVDGIAFLSMELVDGRTLREWLAARDRSWRDVLSAMIAAGRGLAAAHAVGLIHRDFKPENVLVGADDRPRVSDFGLVSAPGVERDGAAALSVTATSAAIVGTPAYMAPEQWLQRPLDARTDQFAFAVTCWEALWGARPFDGRAAVELRDRVVGGVITPVARRAGVPRRVELALRRALAVDAAARWPSLSALLDELDRCARDRRAAIGLAAGGGVIAAVATVVILRVAEQAPPPTCRTATAGVDQVWSPARRAALAAAFAARPEPYATQTWADVERTVDARADQLRALRVDTCELARSDHAGNAALAEARDACGDRRQAELDALLDALAAPDATIVQFARAAAHELPDPAGCAVTVAPDPEPDRALRWLGTRDELVAIRDDLARAATLRALGKPRDALAIAEAVAARAEALAWSPLIAEAQLQLGLTQAETGAHGDAGKAHQRAAWHADASRDDAVRFEATLGLSRFEVQASAYDRAAAQLEAARMIARRLPADAARDVAIASQHAAIAFWSGDITACATRAEDAVALIERTLGHDVMIGAQMRAQLARCLAVVDRGPEIGPVLREALAITETLAGREHPMAAELLSNLGSLARDEDRPDDALALFREALAIRERIFGADSPEVAKLHNNVGNALRDLGRLDEAAASIQRAIAIWEVTWGPDAPAVATGSTALGEVMMDRGDPAAAATLFRRALAIRRVKRPPGHHELLKTLVKLGRALLAQRDRACVPLFEEAVASYQVSDDADPGARAEARFQLGRALIEFDIDRTRGAALVDAACPDLATASWKDEAAACAAYAAAH